MSPHQPLSWRAHAHLTSAQLILRMMSLHSYLAASSLLLSCKLFRSSESLANAIIHPNVGTAEHKLLNLIGIRYQPLIEI